jgi:sterol desaturase/sphingolipid hydroxylase (fatty acid hydroxylase superfamily)
MSVQFTEHRVRLFESDLLERLSHNRPELVVGVWLTIVVALVCWGTLEFDQSALVFVAAALGGFGGWSLAEYLLHRYFFHARPHGAAMRRMVYLVHGNHHVEPLDRERDMMPLSVSLPVGAAIYPMLLWLGGFGAGNILTGFVALGYIAYESIHFATHQTHPRGRVGRFLRRHHLRHHYGREVGNFGVSSPFWDLVFRTLIRTPPNARSLRPEMPIAK